MLIGLEAVLPEGLSLVEDVILAEEEEEEIGLVLEVEMEVVAPAGVLLLALSLTLFELPNQRLRRVMDELDGERLLESSLLIFSFCNACVRVDVESAGSSDGLGISTSSASRYHFLRRVYRSQPSWPRRPSFH